MCVDERNHFKPVRSSQYFQDCVASVRLPFKKGTGPEQEAQAHTSCSLSETIILLSACIFSVVP